MKIDKRNNYILLAENFYLNGNKENAIKFYKKALFYDGPEEDTLIIMSNIAAIYGELEKFEEALGMYNRIIDFDSQNYEVYFNMALIEEQRSNIDVALSFYDKVVEINPTFGKAYYNIATIYDNLGDREKAIEFFYKVLVYCPKDYISYNNIGSIYEEMGEYD